MILEEQAAVCFLALQSVSQPLTTTILYMTCTCIIQAKECWTASDITLNMRKLHMASAEDFSENSTDFEWSLGVLLTSCCANDSMLKLE